MASLWNGPLQSVFDLPLTRRVLGTFHAAACRHLLAGLDAVDATRRQTQTLLALIHHARQTPFGRQHDFRRIRTPADFRRLVPARRPADFARLADLPVLAGWAQRCHRRALGTALALVQQARPAARPLSGSLLWLGDDSAEAAENFPLLARPAVRTAAVDGPPPTCLVGPAGRVAAFLRERPEVAPGLEAVVCWRSDPADPDETLRRAAGRQAVFLEMLCRPEGPLALEDPRFGSLRLLTDSGVYFEFSPAALAGEVNPPRVGLDGVKPGVEYELIVTAPTGLWAGRVGLSVSFDRLDVPLVRFGTLALPAAPLRADAAAPVPAPHRPTAGIRATLPETSAHIPWSARADRE